MTFVGVAVAVLGRKLYAAGGFDGRNRLRRLVNASFKVSQRV